MLLNKQIHMLSFMHVLKMVHPTVTQIVYLEFLTPILVILGVERASTKSGED